MRRLLVLVLALSACGTTSARVSGPTPSDGPLYVGSGRVVSVPGKPVRFCSNTFDSYVGSLQPQPPAYCELGVDVTGVDLDALADRRELQGAVEGRAQLTGTFPDAVLRVTDQQPPTRYEPPEQFTDPPCPAPAGGWPQGSPTDNLGAGALQAFQAAHPDEVPMVALARPSSTQVLAYLLTSGDVAAAEEALRPTYGERLCVEKSHYTVAELHAAQTEPGLQGGPGTQITAYAGSGIGKDGQVTADVSATYLTPAIAAAVARHPKGLVRLELFLNPVGGAP